MKPQGTAAHCWRCGVFAHDARPVGDNFGATYGGGVVMWCGKCDATVDQRVAKAIDPRPRRRTRRM